MPTYNLKELVEMMKPQGKWDEALIARCVDGLGLYAAQLAEEDKSSPKVGELRTLCETLMDYWGFRFDEPSTKYPDLMEAFDYRVGEAMTGGLVSGDVFQTAPNVIQGLFRYGEDLVTSVGADAVGEILQTSKLMKEIAGHWDYEPDVVGMLTDKLDSMVSEIRGSFPDKAPTDFEAWMAVTESSRHKRVEDEIYRLNGRGAMYYTGGEEGVYMRIHKDGKLEAGSYEDAFPHIGEALFHPTVEKQFDCFSEAYKVAMEAGGKQFLVDMFSGQELQPIIKNNAGQAFERPSVLKQIQESRSAPKPPEHAKSEKSQEMDASVKSIKKNQPEL